MSIMRRMSEVIPTMKRTLFMKFSWFIFFPGKSIKRTYFGKRMLRIRFVQ